MFAPLIWFIISLNSVCILFPQVTKVGLKIRAALITEIYRKALSVNSATLSKFSTGQVNLYILYASLMLPDPRTE